MSFDRYLVRMPGFATSIELISNEPGESMSATFEFEEPSRFLIATLSLPNGQQPAWDLGRLELKNNSSAFIEPRNDERVYVNAEGSIVIVNGESAESSSWSVYVNPGSQPVPVAMNLMAFHGGLNAAAPAAPATLVAGPTFKCRGCKMTAKALALAIVAAAALPAIPAALISAVAAYLGVGAVVAGAFIGSVIGDTADIIAEKLCRKIGLC